MLQIALVIGYFILFCIMAIVTGIIGVSLSIILVSGFFEYIDIIKYIVSSCKKRKEELKSHENNI